MFEIKVTEIEGLRLGHGHNKEGATGCTVIICDEGATGGVDVRGGAPGTRETDLLNPMEMVDKIHAVVLSGGSAFGLDASSGVMQYLEEHNIGFDVGVTKVPIVCQAVLFDLVCGNSRVRPDKKMGYDACVHAENYSEDLNGNIGCGMGATVGKFFGPKNSMKGGFGSYCLQVGNLKVGAVVGVNCLGDVIDPSTGKIIAGALKEDLSGFIDTEETMIGNYNKENDTFKGNTTIGIIVTNAKLTKAQGNKIASMAHNGFGRTMRPAHTMFDGDTIFTMATNKVEADINVVGLLAARVMERAIIRGIKEAKGDYGYLSFNDITFNH